MNKTCLFVLLILSSCAAPRSVWNKPRASPADFGNDKYSCLQGSMAAAPATAGVNAAGNSGFNAYGGGSNFAASTRDMNAGVRDQMFGACMQSKGWSLLQPSPPVTTLPPVVDADVTLKKVTAGPVNNPKVIMANTEIAKCKQDFKSGQLKTHVERGQCINLAWTQLMINVSYPNMDLINTLNAQRLLDDTKWDSGKITESEATLDMKQKLFSSIAEEDKRYAPNSISLAPASN